MFQETAVSGDPFFGYDGEHCFVSCPYGSSFPVKWCTTSLLPSLFVPFGTGSSL